MTLVHVSRAQGQWEATASLFAFLWATAHIVHVWHQGDSFLVEPLANLAPLLVLLAALRVITRPRSPHSLAILAFAQMLAFFYQFPFVANHWTLAAFINAGILIGYGQLRFSAGGDTAFLVPRVAGYARLAFLIAYSAAAIAKLNSGFLDPVHSCSLFTLELSGDWLGLTVTSNTGMRTMIIWVVMIIEIAVPVLLIVKPLRHIGIAVAAVFHLLLAITPVVVVMDFTLVVLALTLLFAPDDVGSRLQNEAHEFSIRQPRLVSRLRDIRTPAIWVLVTTVIFLVVTREALVGKAAWMLVTWGAFVVVGVSVVTVGIATLLSYRASGSRPGMMGSTECIPRLHWVLLAALLFNVASPYIGLKTTSSFTMFSNLRTEVLTTNHLFLPRLAFFSYQEDVVEIVESSNLSLAARVEDGQLITYHELRRQLMSEPGSSVSFIRNDVLHTVPIAAEQPELVTLPAWERKFLHFRPIAPDGVPRCQA